MSKSRDRITYIVTGAIIAALYVDLTFLSNIFNLAYGQRNLKFLFFLVAF